MAGVLGLLGDIGSGVAGIVGADQANSALQQGVQSAQANINTGYNTAAGYQQPIQQMGMQNLNTVNQNVNSGAYQTPAYNYQTNLTAPGVNQPSSGVNAQGFGTQAGNYQQGQFNFQQQPGYQFQMQQGLGAINNSASAGGNVLSGGTQKAMANYATGLANQSYNTAYNQYVQGQQLGQGIQQQNYNQALGATQQNLGQYNQNQQMGLQQANLGMQGAMNQYQTANQQQQQLYNQQLGLGNLGVTASNTLGNLAVGQNTNLANLTMQGAQSQAATDMQNARTVGGAISGASSNTSGLGQIGSLIGSIF